MAVARTHLIPIQEITPGGVGVIRNQVIDAVVAQASKELSLPADKLVVRDVRPFNDLGYYSAGTTINTLDDWVYDASTTTANAYTTVTGARTMGDQKYVAIFGVRDIRASWGLHSTSFSSGATQSVFGGAAAFRDMIPALVNFVKINVGGADKCIWDLESMYGYSDNFVGFSPSAVIIPQNDSFNISYYMKTTVAGIRITLQLIGVCVEPRGKLVSP
jgi:hypothetical protein